jgi:EmrB/QacA subfamily drug resistance transporter
MATPAPCDRVIAESIIGTAGSHGTQTLAATILGSSVAFIDGSVVNVALPALASDLNASAADIAWSINAYLLPLGALTLFGGAVGDRFGRRRSFLMGLAVFIAASVLCALAPSVMWLLLARALQGIGAACLLPNSLAILGAAFEGEARGRAIGTWAAVGAIAGAIGPLLGGWLVDAVSWRAIFPLNVPIGAAAAWLAWRYVAESGDSAETASLDWTGAAAATLGLGLLTWALTASAGPSSDVWMLIYAIAGVLSLALFVHIEARRGQDAMMPLTLFVTHTFTGLTLLTFFLYAALGGLFVLLPFTLIEVANFSAVQAGAALFPLPLMIGLGSRVIGKLAARIGSRWLLATGSAIVAIGFLLFLTADGTAIHYWTDVLPGIVVIAIGMAICVAPLTTAVMASVDTAHVGTASGFNSAIARIGGLIATASLGFVFVEQSSPAALIDGYRTAALVGSAAAALSAISAALWMRD